MSAERYEFQINQGGRLEISVDGSVVSVSTPESHTFRAIRQQARDIAALQQVISDQITVIEDLDHRRVKVCDENDQLRKELEKAAREPVAYCDGDNLDIGIPLRFPAFTLPQAFADTPLYAAPPAPVAEIRDVVVTDAVARKVFNAWIDARWRLNEGQDVKYGHAMIAVVRAELGPELGLVTREEMARAIKATDNAAFDCDYMLDSDDCIAVVRGELGPANYEDAARANGGES